MPLNLFKKSRIYNVTSKNLFVAQISHLLDTSTTVDCTLSADSTGLECLENVCQRLSINQPEFFGLRYTLKGSRTDELRWVDLDAPLSRQLEKYAAGLKLFLHVHYYIISGVSLLEDEVTRFYYFLQLKSDVIEGRIQCDARQAILLALYCRQAQYDTYQNDRNTIDYLKNLLPFPKDILDLDGIPETLIQEILLQNPGLQTLNQSAAEECFIAVCQQIDGYGQEKFNVRDNEGNDLQLGLSINGIATIYSDKIKFYPWHEVINVLQVKRNFIIENNDQKLQFVFSNTDSSLYFYRQFILQHFFYTKYEQNVTASPTLTAQITQNHKTLTPSSTTNLFQNYAEGESYEDLLNEQLYFEQQTHQHQQVLDNKIASNLSLATNSSAQLRQQQQYQQFLQQQQQQQHGLPPHEYPISHLPTDHLENKIQSTSCLDLSNNNFNVHDKEKQDILKANLPSYQPAPDYETALKYKAAAASNEISQIILPPMLYQGGSQPDVHNIHKENSILSHLVHQQQSQQNRYPDVTQVLQNEINTNLYSNLDLVQRLQMMRLKPPPPYSANRLSSTSTPDLAVAACGLRTPLGYRGNNYVSGSSPDLVSTRTHFLNNTHHQYQPTPIQYSYINQIAGHSQPYIPHGTFENLNMIEEQPSALMFSLKQPTAVPQPMYRSHQPQQQQPPQLPHMHNVESNLLHKSGVNGSIEPIYENLPFLCNSQQQLNPAEVRNLNINAQTADNRHRQSNEAIDHHQLQHQNTKLMNTTPVSSNFTLNRDEAVHDVNVLQNRMNDRPSYENNMQKKHPTSTEIANKTDLSQSIPSSSASTSYSHYSSEFLSSANNSATSNGSLNQKEQKRKKRWGILGLSSKNSSEKKSATLGREKKKGKNKDENLNSDDPRQRYRWSTGLPKLQPLPATYSKDKLCQILDSKLQDPQLYLEFQQIPRCRENARYEYALLEENKIFNCDDQFLPYDDNRVKITPTRENRTGYVNASHISATVGSNHRFYILGQSPFDIPTTKIFWQTIWDADVYLLIQLSDELNYIPPTPHKRIECGQFQIFQEFSQKTDRCITSKLRLYHQQSKRFRSVWHLMFNNWAEQNCPSDVGLFLDFLEEFNSVRSASINEVPPGHNSNPPIFIHCREGAGRSGVTLVADLLLYTLDHNQDLDIPRVIGELRQQRDNVIPSLAQYKFIYALLITYLKRTRLI